MLELAGLKRATSRRMPEQEKTIANELFVASLHLAGIPLRALGSQQKDPCGYS